MAWKKKQKGKNKKKPVGGIIIPANLIEKRGYYLRFDFFWTQSAQRKAQRSRGGFISLRFLRLPYLPAGKVCGLYRLIVEGEALKGQTREKTVFLQV
jgi:hypothetical protein